jgi:WD40 repeat protein
VDAHYQVFNTSTNELIFTTNAKYLYPSENDVKAGAFSSDSTRFAAAYHYREDRDYTWVRVWNAQTGGVLYDLEIDGWTTDLSGVFN